MSYTCLVYFVLHTKLQRPGRMYFSYLMQSVIAFYVNIHSSEWASSINLNEKEKGCLLDMEKLG